MIHPTPTLSQGSPNTLSPADVEQAQVPPSSTLCGRVTIGPVDGTLIVLGIFTLAATIFFLISDMYLSCGLMGGAAGSCCIVYGTYQKYGNLAVQIKKLNLAISTLKQSLANQTQELGTLSSQLATLSKLNEKLNLQIANLQSANQNLQQETAQIQQEDEKFAQTDRDLQLLTPQFEGVTQKIASIDENIKTQIAGLQLQNEAAQKEEEAASSLNQHQLELKNAITRLGEGLRQDIGSLKELLSASQTLTLQKMKISAQEKEQLKSALQETTATLETFTELKKSYEELYVKFHALKQSLPASLSAAQEEREAEEAQVRNLQSVLNAMPNLQADLDRFRANLTSILQ